MKKILKYLFVGSLLFGLGVLINAYRKHQIPHFQKRKIKKIPASKEFHSHLIHRKRNHRHIMIHDFGLRNKRRVVAGLMILMVSGIVGEVFLQKYSFFLKTSLLNIESVPFTGTIAPVEKVPNWVQLTENERKLSYDQLPKNKFIKLPKYDVNLIKQGYKSNGSGNVLARNTYITYPVLNMGDYLLAGHEGNGSHTGIDIKLPMNTPIRAIADGVVYKSESKPTGFGTYVSLAHMNVPNPNNKTEKINIVSTYAHLSSSSVINGQKVKKGQIIGKSGSSGMATAPHLHFQIDKDSADFHPYWPFSWNDVRSAGLNSYFEAVNKGVGARNGHKHTIHPVQFISAFENYQGIEENLVVSTTPIIETNTSDKQLTEPQNTSHTHTEEHSLQDLNHTSEYAESNRAFEPEIKTNDQKRKYHEAQRKAENEKEGNKSFHRAMMEESLSFDTDLSFIPGEAEIVEVHIEDENLIASNGILIESTLKHLAEVKPSRLTKKNFENGTAQVSVKTESDSSFRLIAKGDFGQIKSKSLRASIFEDIPKTHRYADAIKYLKDNQIVKGYGDGTFRADNQINRAESVKILLEGNNIPTSEQTSSFPDVGTNAWFTPYVATASKQGIVKGYSDGSFKPEQPISRAEFTKVALETANIAIPNEANNLYADVKEDMWFSRYMSVAKRYNFFETYGGGNVEPSRPITRGEAAFIMYKIEELS